MHSLTTWDENIAAKLLNYVQFFTWRYLNSLEQVYNNQF